MAPAPADTRRTVHHGDGVAWLEAAELSSQHAIVTSLPDHLGLEQSSADVLPSLGEMVWARAMGADICNAVASFLLAHTACRTVVDPFCGHGTMLAMANTRGLDAIGIESSRKRVKKARALTWSRQSAGFRDQSRLGPNDPH